MGVHYSDNAWWLDVLEWGPKSRYAKSFDIDWDMLPHRRKPGLLLPILGASYGEALNNGEIELRYDAQAGEFSAWYYEHRLPIAPARYSELLRTIVTAGGAEDSTVGAALLELARQLWRAKQPRAEQTRRGSSRTSHGSPTVLRSLHEVSKPIDARNGSAQTLALHHLLERQHYRLSHWRLAGSDINYRRFFDVNSLAGSARRGSRNVRKHPRRLCAG